MTLRTLLLVSAASIAATSCSTWRGQAPAVRLTALASQVNGVETDPAACRDRMAESAAAPGAGLDSSRLGILSWNVKKGQHSNWRHDLARMAADKHLILIQEASLGPELLDALEPTAHWAFAPGYRTRMGATGVMTLSSTPPLTQCNLQIMEPWLRTPKATSITEFGLTGTNETLVVANIHAVNFSVGVVEFRQQIQALRTALADHAGPIILSGDFNTWRTARLDILSEVTRELGLEPIGFDNDHRTLAFGLPLDHLFVRGLAVQSSATRSVRTSDHNPLAAEFAVIHPIRTADDVSLPEELAL
ncbi:MAG: endonuclease/exonuclease/phosphatase family protein [Chromatiales bacterium]|nr:MAG: endonuclease/exonuclease/phosphatase family protein [Chromatiales bacterium]